MEQTRGGTAAAVADAAPADSIAELLRVQARARPDAPAVTGQGRHVTYGELDRRANRVAAALRRLGVGRGDRVAYLDRNATEYWEVFFAAAKLGAAVAPLNFRLGGPEVRVILDDAEPAVLVVGAEYAAALAGHLPPGLPTVVFGGEVPGGAVDYEAWVGDGPADDPHADGTGDDLAVLMYSSGTTGRPKGVRTTVANLRWGVEHFAGAFAPDEHSASLVPPPYYHVAAGGWALITLAAGGRVIQVRDPDPVTLLRLMVEHRATHTALVPALIAVMVDHPEAVAADWSSLRHVVYGGSPIGPDLLRRAVGRFGADLTQSYGLTECVGVGTLLRPDDHRSADPARLASAGQAVDGVELRVVDPDTGTPVAAGEVGEIEMRSPAVTPGYWRRPEETAAAFRPGGWLRTGDAGRLDVDGYLTIVDRIKDLIVTGGENVASLEVEAVLAGHPDVADVAVVAAPSGRWGETPHAFVVLRPGAAVTGDDLRSHCRDHLAGYKCPGGFSFVAELPRNPSGKVLKRQLREPLWAGHAGRVG